MYTIFLDTETTDLNPEARLVQLAYKDTGTGKIINEYFKPLTTISFESMAIHHITNKMVEDKPFFANSLYFVKLQETLQNNILVAHNASFDIGILKNEGMEVGEYIDTLRVARHMLDSEQHSLQYLRYFLDLDVEGIAHDALGDILVLEKLFEYLKKNISRKFSIDSEEEILQKMLELTKMPVLLPSFGFGKYKGKTFAEVRDIDRSYLQWLYGSETMKPESEQNEDLVYTLKNYL